MAYDLSFTLFKKGSTKEVVSSQSSLRWEARGQSAEVELDAGEYVLHVGENTLRSKVHTDLFATRFESPPKLLDCP
jgi:hypothetical protein